MEIIFVSNSKIFAFFAIASTAILFETRTKLCTFSKYLSSFGVSIRLNSPKSFSMIIFFASSMVVSSLYVGPEATSLKISPGTSENMSPTTVAG